MEATSKRKTGWQKAVDSIRENDAKKKEVRQEIRAKGGRPPSPPKLCSNCFEPGHTAPHCPHAGPVRTFEQYEQEERRRR